MGTVSHTYLFHFIHSKSLKFTILDCADLNDTKTNKNPGNKSKGNECGPSHIYSCPVHPTLSHSISVPLLLSLSLFSLSIILSLCVSLPFSLSLFLSLFLSLSLSLSLFLSLSLSLSLSSTSTASLSLSGKTKISNYQCKNQMSSIMFMAHLSSCSYYLPLLPPAKTLRVTILVRFVFFYIQPLSHFVGQHNAYLGILFTIQDFVVSFH